jgi:hypothetical protein
MTSDHPQIEPIFNVFTKCGKAEKSTSVAVSDTTMLNKAMLHTNKMSFSSFTLRQFL